MRPSKKLIAVLILGMISFNFTACDKKNISNSTVENSKAENNQSLKKHLNFSDVVIIRQKGNESDVFNLKDYKLSDIGKLNNLGGLIYSKGKSVYIYLLNIFDKEGVLHNKIKIEKGNDEVILNDSFLYSDLKMSSDGSKIAYRSFKDKTIASAEGMSIYDIKEFKKIKIDSEVLISGNLYEWLNENEILYYGAIPGKLNSNKIYKYDLKSKQEKIYYDNIDGYCMYFFPIENKGVLFLENKEDESRACYFNFEKNKKTVLSNSIKEIYKSVFDSKNNVVFFLGKIFGENDTALYKLDLQNTKIERITYDLPKTVDEKAGLVIDKNHNVVFGGINLDNKDNDVYLYDLKENTTRLITDHSAIYRIYGEK